jgi:hypothetical protein
MAIDIQLSIKRMGIFGETSCEHNDFKVRGHVSDEFFAEGAFGDENRHLRTVNFNFKVDVTVWYGGKTRMDQSFI